MTSFSHLQIEGAKGRCRDFLQNACDQFPPPFLSSSSPVKLVKSKVFSQTSFMFSITSYWILKET